MENWQIYEAIYCSVAGCRNREKLINEYKEEIEDFDEIMEKEHQKGGLKINNKPIYSLKN